MSLFRRAFLYLMRKRVKTITLFLIVFVIATLALSSVAFKGAVQTAQLNVREALGGCFVIQPNYNKSTSWEVLSDENGEIIGAKFRGAMPSEELADSIAAQLDGLLGFNLSGGDAIRAFNAPDGYDLLHVASGTSPVDAELIVEAIADGFENLNDLYATFGAHLCTNSALDYYFTSGEMTLLEGRHLNEGETGAVLISDELAKQNGLTVGDTFYLRDSNLYLISEHIKEPVYFPVTIVGIFSINGTSAYQYSCECAENMMFMTASTLEKFSMGYQETDEEIDLFHTIHFYANDPEDLESMVEKVETLPGFGKDGDFTVTVQNEAILAVKGPLENIDRLVTILFLLILGIGIIILCLILSARIKERIRETGILLSVGVKKSNILLQYLAEITVVTLLACTVAVFGSMFVTKTAGTMLLQGTITDTMESYTQQASSDDYEIPEGWTTIDSGDSQIVKEGGTLSQELTEITVSVHTGEIVLLYAAGLLLAWGAVTISSIPLFRLKPREILSKMS